MLDREAALYRGLAQRGVETSFVTYGDRSDLDFAEALEGIRILVNRWGLDPARYERWLWLLHGPWLGRADVFKTNQTFGGDVAARAARIWSKPLVARCGYMWSEFVGRAKGFESGSMRAALNLEQDVFGTASRVVVTTEAMKAWIGSHHPGLEAKARVIPNYVDLETFRPQPELREPDKAVFLGRLTDQKNVFSLVEAFEDSPYRLTVIGDGAHRAELQKRFGDLNGRLEWLGNVDHRRIPEVLNRASVFVLPSLYEGHPKALLEAMACGLPVIGADSPGIRPVIRDGRTGLLCGTDPDSIRAAVDRVMTEPELAAEMGRAAREDVERNCSLERVIEMELDILTELTGNRVDR